LLLSLRLRLHLLLLREVDLHKHLWLQGIHRLLWHEACHLLLLLLLKEHLLGLSLWHVHLRL
jgi:hypothetical protein